MAKKTKRDSRGRFVKTAPAKRKPHAAKQQSKPAPVRRTRSTQHSKPKRIVKPAKPPVKRRTAKPAPVPRKTAKPIPKQRKRVIDSIPEPRRKRGRRALLDDFPELDGFDELDEMLEHDEDEESEKWNSKESWFSIDSGERALKAAQQKKKERVRKRKRAKKTTKKRPSKRKVR